MLGLYRAGAKMKIIVMTERSRIQLLAVLKRYGLKERDLPTKLKVLPFQPKTVDWQAMSHSAVTQSSRETKLQIDSLWLSTRRVL